MGVIELFAKPKSATMVGLCFLTATVVLASSSEDISSRPAGDTSKDLERDGFLKSPAAAQPEGSVTATQPKGFAFPVFIPLGGMSFGVLVGDADNDGDNDIVSGSFVPWDGYFGSPVPQPWGLRLGLFIGDADNDGQNEVVGGRVISRSIRYPPFSTTSYWVFIYNWNGSEFVEQIQLRLVGSPASIFVGDADNDGDNDIVVATNTAYGGAISLVVFPWNGLEFDPAISLQLASFPTSVFVADADNDGDNDIVTTTVDGISLIRWNGKGFDPERVLSPALDVTGATVADADNDGDNEIIVTAFQEKDVFIFGWRGSDLESSPFRLPVGDLPGWVVVADIDNDKDNDIVIGVQRAVNDEIFIFRWNGLDFEPPERFRVSVGGDNGALDVDILSLNVGDADNDGDNDILITANITPTIGQISDFIIIYRYGLLDRAELWALYE